MDDGWKMTCHKDHRVANVDLRCGDCIVRVDAWSPMDGDPRTGDLFVTVISSSLERYHGMWRNRLKNAWAVLRNRYDWSGFQLADDNEARQLAEAISAGGVLAFAEDINDDA